MLSTRVRRNYSDNIPEVDAVPGFRDWAEDEALLQCCG